MLLQPVLPETGCVLGDGGTCDTGESRTGAIGLDGWVYKREGTVWVILLGKWVACVRV